LSNGRLFAVSTWTNYHGQLIHGRVPEDMGKDPQSTKAKQEEDRNNQSRLLARLSCTMGCMYFFEYLSRPPGKLPHALTNFSSSLALVSDAAAATLPKLSVLPLSRIHRANMIMSNNK